MCPTNLIPAAVPVNATEIVAPGDVITIITSTSPATVGKVFDVVDGRLTKSTVGNIAAGRAQGYGVADLAAMADMLDIVTAARDEVIVSAEWNGDDGGVFDVVTEQELARLRGQPVGADELAGVHTIGDRRVAARLRRSLAPSCWLLLDADNPPGVPDEWARMDAVERLALWEPLLPGISTAGRVELRSSSARVRHCNEAARGPSHIWIKVDDPANIATMKAALAVRMVLQGIAFKSPRHSRHDGSVIGHAWRSAFDLAVFDAGRVVFCSMPTLTQAAIDAGYVVDDADVAVVDGAPLVVSGIELPTVVELARYRELTGENIALRSADGGGLAVHNEGALTLDAEIESRGVVQPLRAWLAGLRDGESMRCEAPFRASVSEAAFLRRTGPGVGFVFDVGNATTYVLSAEAVEADRQAAAVALGERLRDVMPAERVAQAEAESDLRATAQLAEVVAGEAARATERATIGEVFATGPYVVPDPATLRRRDWIMSPAYLRGDLSAVVATTGVGKSLLLVAEALSLVSGKALLSPRVPARRHRVALINAEDKRDELELRIAAAMKRHRLTPDDLGDRLFILTPRAAFALTDRDTHGSVRETEHVAALIDFLKRNEIDALIVDPLASFNKSDETNEGMQAFVEALRRVADANQQVAIRIAHHTNKVGATDGDVQAARGGTAFIAGVRQADRLAAMTVEEARERGIPADQRRQYVKLSDGKSNFAAVDADRWFRILPDTLDCDGGVERVAAIVPYTPPTVTVPYAVARDAHAYLMTHGVQRAHPQASDWFGWVVAGFTGQPGVEARTADVRRHAVKLLAILSLRRVIVAGGAQGHGHERPGYTAGALPSEAAWLAEGAAGADAT